MQWRIGDILWVVKVSKTFQEKERNLTNEEDSESEKTQQ